MSTAEPQRYPRTSSKTDATASRVSLTTVMERENELLKESVAVRDQQILMLKASMAHMRVKMRPKFGAVEENQRRTASELNEELQKYKLKYAETIQVIEGLHGTIRQLSSKMKATEAQLGKEIETLKKDMKYQSEQHQRVIENMEITNQKKMQQRMSMSDRQYIQKIQLYEEEIKQLKMDNSAAKLEILKLNQQLKTERSKADEKRKHLEAVNSELRTSVQRVDGGLRKENKERQQYLIQEFKGEVVRMHQEQATQVRVLCERIDSLKSALTDKEAEVKQLWKLRNEQAHRVYHLHSSLETQKTSKKASLSTTMATQGPSLLEKFMK